MRGESERAAIASWSRQVREAVPCINSIQGTAYLNKPAVKAALHVTDSPNTWAICGGVDYKDDGVYASMVAVHKAMLPFKPRVLVYNGDVDPGCNYLWAQSSVKKFGVALAEGGVWHPWVYDTSIVGEQLGGFVTDYEGDIHFATIHGAGHMSPQWRPQAAFTMVERFLAGKPL